LELWYWIFQQENLLNFISTEEVTDSGENSLGTSSSAETDPLSSMLASMVRQPPSSAMEMHGLRGFPLGKCYSLEENKNAI
jgi:hypothetical protein